MKRGNGVTLIALAVTIIVMLILAGVTISTLTGNSGITTKASKAKTKSYLANIKEEYELYLSEKRMDDEYDLDTLYANDKTIRYEGNEVGTGIAEICSSIKKGDEKKFEIIKGKIYYVSQDKNVIPIAVELGFSINPYEITDGGVLKSSSMNLYLVDNDGHLDLSEYEGKIKTIEAGAFSKVEIESGINPLQSIVLPKGITTIGDDAFSYNTSLTSIKIPNTVTSIGKRAFQECTNLTSIEIPDTVTYIGDYCFSGCNRLQKIKLSKKIQTINQRLLQGCSSLTEIEIPEGVKSIGYAAFSSCSKLTTITLPASLTSFNGTALAGLSRLTEVKVADGNNSFKFENGMLLSKDGKTMYMALLTLTEINVPNGVVSIVGDTLSGSSATKIILPDTVSSNLSGTVFNGMNKLSTIELSSTSKNLKLVDGNLYSYDGKRFIKYMGTSKTFTVPEGVETLVCRCITKSMTTLNLPSTLKVIEGWSLASMSGVNLLNIPASVTTMYTYSFHANTKLRVAESNSTYKSIDDVLILNKAGTKVIMASKNATTYNIPNTVTEIGKNAFYGCSKITSITIPDSVTTIGAGAFESCSSLTEITIPQSVTSIGSDAFVYCGKLMAINIKGEEGRISGGPWGAQYGNRVINWNV
ncbi:ig-like domain-containing surface protein [Clostridium sp. CAG:269]|nr:ig-like domain-containing surface protein [Clostridium sp. CAG:269]